MNTTVDEIIELYLSKIECYEYLKYSEEELKEEIRPMLNSAISKLFTLDLSIDWDMEEFDRQLTPIEQNIIALGLVEEFINQRVNSEKVLRNHLNMKDYQKFSNANMLKQLNDTLASVRSDVSYLETRLEYKKRAKKILDGDKK